jgi:hypothetical protein
VDIHLDGRARRQEEAQWEATPWPDWLQGLARPRRALPDRSLGRDSRSCARPGMAAKAGKHSGGDKLGEASFWRASRVLRSPRRLREGQTETDRVHQVALLAILNTWHSVPNGSIGARQPVLWPLRGGAGNRRAGGTYTGCTPPPANPAPTSSTPPPEHSWPRRVLMAALRAHPSLGECMTRTRRAIGRLGHASLHPGMARLRILPLAAPRRDWQPLVMSYLRRSPGDPSAAGAPLARARGSAEVAVAWHGLSLVCQRSACVLIANGAVASGLAVSA